MKNPEVVGTAPFVNGQGLLAYSSNVRGVMVRGIIPSDENAVADLGRDMRVGQITSLAAGEYNIILGAELARALGVSVGTKLQLITPQGSVTPAGMVPRLRSFTVSGIFSSGHYEYDSTLALIHMKDAQVLFRLGENVSGVRIKLKDTNRARGVSRELQNALRIDGFVTDWTKQNETYFRAVEIEKRASRRVRA